jgi:hypothetical protein
MGYVKICYEMAIDVKKAQTLVGYGLLVLLDTLRYWKMVEQAGIEPPSLFL